MSTMTRIHLSSRLIRRLPFALLLVLYLFGWASGLSLADFYKRISVQELSQKGLGAIAGAIATLARLEGLEAHARAAEARQEPDGRN